MTPEPLSPLKRALLELRHMRAQLEEFQSARAEPVAIVGMGCRYPGAEGLAQFWGVLREGIDTVSELPDSRWDAEALYDPDPAAPGKMVTRRGGFLPHLDEFDADFFHVAPREAPFIDPRQRLILECAWEALEDAGISPFELSGSRTGVYMATLTMDYGDMLLRDLARVGAFSGAGAANSVIANRLSYFLDLHGPSITVDTACSGSLVAIHMACEALRNREIGLALAGGVSVNLLARSNVFFSKAGALSPGGACRTFDRRADGMVRSDGAGVIALKLLTQARKDGDPIVALIRASALNHDGRSNGIMAPNGEAQAAVIEEAYRRAGMSPGEVQYVETHGTGTKLGDPIEVRALGGVLARGRAAGWKCVLGSLKTNIGHTESAAGVAGVIGTALAMKHRTLPPTVHFSEPNPLIPFDELQFEIRTQAGPWPDESVTRVAGVSGFGFGGSNAHVVLEEAPPETVLPELAQPPYLLPLSARTGAALRALAEAYGALLADPAAVAGDICYTAGARRAHHGVRLSIGGESREGLGRKLLQWLPGADDSRQAPEPPRIAFVFSGQGSHWAGMGRGLLAREPVFREAVERCARLFAEHARWQLVEEMCREGAGSRLDDTELAQPAIFSIQIGLAALWRSWGIAPATITGHSLGEAAAACVAGAISLEDGVRVVYRRSRLMQGIAGRGKTAVVGLDIDQARAAIAGRETSVAVAGSNGPGSSLLSGEPAAIDAILQALAARGAFCREVPGVDIAFHSPQMDPLRDELVRELQGIAPRAAAIPLISTVTGGPVEGASLDARYWGRNLRDPFLFMAAAQWLLRHGHNAIVEVSPHPVLSSAILQNVRQAGPDCVKAVPSLRRHEGELATLYGSLGALYELGAPVDWKAVHRAGGRSVSLPSYPWQRQRYWFDQLPGGMEEDLYGKSLGLHPLLGERIERAAPATSGVGRMFLWEMAWGALHPAYLADHRVREEVVAPGAAYLELALAAGRQLFPSGAWVSETVFERPLALPQGGRTRLQLSAEVQGDSADFVLYARPDNGDAWVRYVSGRLAATGAAESAALPDQTPAQIQQRCPEQLAVEAHYEAMRAAGLEYGPAFRSIRRLWRGQGEALAEIQLGAALFDRRYHVHPAILDAAFQTVAAAAQGYGAANYLPYSVGRWEAAALPEGRVWCHAQLAGEPGAKSLSAELTLMDDSGRVAARLSQLTLRRLAPAPLIGARAGARASLLETRWEARPLIPGNALAPPKRWLVLSDAGGTGARVAAQLRDRECDAVEAPPDGCESAEGMRKLLEASGPFDGIVHLRSLDARAEALDEAVALTCDSVLHVAQAIVASGSATRLWLVTRDAQPAARGPLAVEQSPLWGLALSIAREHPELRCSSVDLDPAGGQAPLDEALLEELLGDDGEDRIAWRGGVRLVARLAVASPPLNLAPPQLHADGTYLIAGGFGALGLATARYLVELGARHLALVSRHGGDGQGAAIRELELAGAHVTAISADIADQDQAERLFTETLATLPPLRGVIHSAGVLDDARLGQLTPARLRKVVAPKVQGAFNLHLLTKDRPLDFFVCYSSAASLIGSAGQGNYAAGNAFLDALAHHRRALGLPASAINWGAWEGGMATGSATRQRLAAHGVTAIRPREGLDLLGSLLQPESPAQIGVFPVDWRTFAGQFAGRVPRLFENLVPAATASATTVARPLEAPAADRAAHVLSFVRAELAAVLGVRAADRIPARQGFFDLGMDSLMAMEFKARLEAGLGLKLSVSLVLEYGNLEALSSHLAALALAVLTPPAEELYEGATA